MKKPTKNTLIKQIEDELKYWQDIEFEASSRMEDLVNLRDCIRKAKTITPKLRKEFCDNVPARN